VSAIAGVIGLDGRPVGESDLAGVARLLAPLGPDGAGAWSGRAGRLGVALTAALRRRTPEDEADVQPAFDAGRSLALVGDLRIDNRGELAALLGLRDAIDVPDSAFVLAAYARWGERCLERIHGAFALAIVDFGRGGVLLARDHLGLQPLVVHERPGLLAFSSTALSLTALEGVGHRLDMQRAAEILALAYHSERTMVAGVRWLPPAGAMWLDAAGVRRWTWWRPALHATRDDVAADAFAAELRAALDEAVAARLRSAGPVGAMTSGGLDSTSVAATAAGLLGAGPLRTYTSAPPPGWSAAPAGGWDADETPLVHELAGRYPNIAPTFVHVERRESIMARHEELWELGGGPERNPCNSLWMHALLERASGDGVTTVLTGARGNYFFSAHGREWLVALLRSGRVAALA
jgi:asparagine synthase (glutamine-hydrolysing)